MPDTNAGVRGAPPFGLTTCHRNGDPKLGLPTEYVSTRPHATMWALLTACLLTVAPSVAAAQKACAGSEGYDALDFWVGEWDVFVGQRQVGQSRITKILQGCAVTEEWTDAFGGEGRSLFYRAPGGGPWRQVWVSDTALTAGGVKEKELVEMLPGGGVRFQGIYPDDASGSWHDRTTLTPTEGGGVRQLIERSRDSERWEKTFDAVYRRRGSATPPP